MEELANKIAELIKDYRNEDGISIDQNHVIRWANQFEEKDREFLLSELLHILPKSYLSKNDVIETLEEVFEYLRKKYSYDTIQSFLNNSRFLSCQSSAKSQSVLLNFLNEIAMKKYGVSILEMYSEKPKLWIYFDDVLGSGGTFRKNIGTKIDEYGKDNYISEDIKLICIFFFLHSWGRANAKFVLLKKYSKDLANSIDFHGAFEIQNNPRINFFNPNPKFNHAFPKQTDIGKTYIDNLEESLDLGYDMNYSKFAFRSNDKPSTEEFYSSPENRDRYESIILKKGIEIIDDIEHLSAKGTRPLGFTPPSYKTLGTGSHAFTWRNISNTCPLVYWWEVNNWIPLFSVQNRGVN